jgi:hypothetical protein
VHRFERQKFFQGNLLFRQEGYDPLTCALLVIKSSSAQ